MSSYILKIIAGFLMATYGNFKGEIDKLGIGLSILIGIVIWILFFTILSIAEKNI